MGLFNLRTCAYNWIVAELLRKICLGDLDTETSLSTETLSIGISSPHGQEPPTRASDATKVYLVFPEVCLLQYDNVNYHVEEVDETRAKKHEKSF